MLKRKSIEFDLSKAKLEECGFKVNSKSVKEKLEPYTQIRDALKALGFEHRQGSVYHSIEPMTHSKVRQTIKKLDQQLTWLNECVKKFDTTDVPALHDLTAFWKETANTRKEQERPAFIKELPYLDVEKTPSNSIDFDEIAVKAEISAL
ncbi:MAG: hypothetical protein FWG70_06750 [Oscillospiraceae bacterium]|nr:hypothetical protein [Oscillospiraceae bacterium]